MMDHEFSSPRAEFSPPRQEFAPPRPEFTPPKGEQHAPGAEFAQSPAVPEPKKRRVNPLMLTAAAVASSAIILTPVSVRPSVPSLQLNADQRAYMSELSAALDAQDDEWLITLATDPRKEELLSLLIAAEETYDDHEETILFGYEETESDYIHLNASFLYDAAQGMAYPYTSRPFNKDTTCFWLSSIVDGRNSYQGNTYSHTSFSHITDGISYTGSPYYVKKFSADFIYGEGYPYWWNIQDMTLQWDKNAKYHIPIEGTSSSFVRNDNGSDFPYSEINQLTVTGTYAYDPEKSEDNLPDSERYYLENGTALWSSSRDGIQTDISFEVKNGQTINDGQFLIDSYQYTDGLKYFITNADQIPCTFAEYGDSVDDLLFHTFHYGR